MSEFLMVVPDGWTEIADPESMYGESSWQQFLSSDVTEALKQAGLIAQDDSEEVADFRVFRDAAILRLWILLVPHVVG